MHVLCDCPDVHFFNSKKKKQSRNVFESKKFCLNQRNKREEEIKVYLNFRNRFLTSFLQPEVKIPLEQI